MYTINLGTDKLKLICPDLPRVDKEKLAHFLSKSKGTRTQIDLEIFSKEAIDKFLTMDLTDKQRSQLVCWGTPQEDQFAAEVGTAEEFYNYIANLNSIDGPNMDVFFNNRWYPVKFQFHLYSTWTHEKFVQAAAVIEIGSNLVHGFSIEVGPHDFTNEAGDQVKKPIMELLEKNGIRPVDQDNLRQVTARIRKAMNMSSKTGQQMLIWGPGIVHNTQSWWGSSVGNIDLGSAVTPIRGCIEDVFEIQQHHRSRYHTNGAVKIPLVRLFCLDKKRYVYVDVEDLTEYQYDEKATERLVLPDDIKGILTTVFENRDALFGDVIAHKGGGMTILAHGGTGVGKTLTAEIFAEYTKRPLYTLELGELGVTLNTVEENLQKIFMRASRWNAILLFDECDVFLHKRNDNLERSAIVGVFLRLMDYYQGVMFLTSNRGDVLDPAIQSRLALSLQYPNLDSESRRKIWEMLFKLANVELIDGLSDIPSLDINGRKIRNIVRLARAVHKNKVTSNQIRDLLKYCGVQA